MWEWVRPLLPAPNAFGGGAGKRARYFDSLGSRHRDGAEELYDCLADPHEWRNQAANADSAAALKELRASVPPLSEMEKSMPGKRGAKDE